MNWREVKQSEFYEEIGKQNVHPSIEGRYPYTSVFKTPSGQVRGKVVAYYPEGSSLAENKYYLPDKD